jgi:DNA-binding PadR family transcriptional regulator
MPFKPSDSALPLTPISFEVLLALLDGDLHGYAILQAVEARLAGKLPLRTGTMYRALARLLDEKLIERSGSGAEADPRRRNYRITTHGRATARAEARRLADQVDAARAHRLLPESRK